MKSEDVYADLAEDFEARFDTLNSEVDRPLPIGKNKKIIGLMKDESGRRTMKGQRLLLVTMYLEHRAREFSFLKLLSTNTPRNVSLELPSIKEVLIVMDFKLISDRNE